MQNIYFTVMHDEFEDGEKLDWAIVVEKEFWDQYKKLDDTMDKNLENAFAGLVSLDGPENVSWEHDYISIDKIVSHMNNKGYNLLINDETFINEFQKKYGVEPKNYYASV